MSFNPLKALKDALGIAAKITGIPLLQGAAELLTSDDAIKGLPADKQAELQEALMKHSEEMLRLQTEDMKVATAESLAEINSEDWFTRRARPFCVYMAGIITAGLAVAAMCGIKLDTALVISLMAPLWGSAGYYTYNRTQEKLAK